MTNDLERVTRMAKECGANINRGWSSTATITFSKKQLLAFEQAVLAECLAEIHVKDVVLQNMQVRVESLQAKLAMQAVAFYSLINEVDSQIVEFDKEKLKASWYEAVKALNATQPTVDAFMAKKKAEWEKSVWLQASELASRNLYDNKQYAELFAGMANKKEV